MILKPYVHTDTSNSNPTLQIILYSHFNLLLPFSSVGNLSFLILNCLYSQILTYLLNLRVCNKPSKWVGCFLSPHHVVSWSHVIPLQSQPDWPKLQPQWTCQICQPSRGSFWQLHMDWQMHKEWDTVAVFCGMFILVALRYLVSHF